MTPECAICHKSGEGIVLVDFPAYSICEECIDDDPYVNNISTGCDD